MILDSLAELANTRVLVKLHPGRKVVVTNGCFDLFHPGHLHTLKQMWLHTLGMDTIVFVLVNSDKSVRVLKGPGRPVQDEQTRAEMVCSIKYVDHVYIFDSERCDKELDVLQPHYYFKGDDRKLEDLDPAEHAVLDRHGSRITFIPRMAEQSTTEIISNTKGE